MDKREREKSEDGKRDREKEGQREMPRWRGKENTRGGRSPSEGSAGPGGRGTREGEEEKRAREQLAAAERQSCAHFFSWPNPKTLLCPPKINYPPYSKNETGREQRNAARATRRSSRAWLASVVRSPFIRARLDEERNEIILRT